MRFDVGVILAAVAFILALFSIAGIGGFAMLAAAVLLLSLAYLVPAWTGRSRLG
jgi:hypothetical protein